MGAAQPCSDAAKARRKINRNTGGIVRHARHDPVLNACERAAKNQTLVTGDHYLIITWDGPNFPGTRQASFVSDTPVGDVKLICKAVADQIKND